MSWLCATPWLVVLTPRGPYVFTRWWVVLSLVALALGLIAAGVFWWRRRRKAAAFVPEVPADQEALQALRELGQKPWDGSGKELVLAVSRILRRYVSREFALPALEKTTEEFFAMAVGHPVLAEEVRRDLQQFLERGDLVKYAGQSVTPAECETFLTQTENFVVTTHQQRLLREMAAVQAAGGAAPDCTPKPA